MTHEQLAVIRDVSKFLAEFYSQGFGDIRKARHLALALADIGGEGREMNITLARVDEAERPRICPRIVLSELAGLVSEFSETGRSRAGVGDENGALVFFSCGERVAEIFRPLVAQLWQAPVRTAPPQFPGRPVPFKEGERVPA